MNPRAVLELRNIRKAYPGVVAVDGVDLTLHAGEIHALVGENGAGKSTLAGIAAGERSADEGTVTAHGTVGLVHQHFELVQRLRVWENVLLGREPRRGAQLDAAAARRHVAGLARDNGLEIDPDAAVETLPIGVQQRVELLRELDRNPAVLLLDEPTAALAPAEIASFFKTIVNLAQRGTAVLIVTHKLQEVIDYATRITVMRHGKVVERMQTSETTVDAIARAMVGGELPAVARRLPTEKRPCLRVRMPGLSFDVEAGEIVGIAGVEGNGQTTLVDAIAGVTPHEGSIDVESGNRPRMGIVPQDRQREALVMPWSIVDNVILGRQQRVRRGATLDRARAHADALQIEKHYDVRAASLQAPVRTLSGGNQQKVVVGRALIDEPALVVAYNPTRGIDVGAAALVQSRLIEARNNGAAVLLVSFELDEIFALADRVLVMYRDAIVGEVDAHDDAARAEVGRLMAGAR
jgi:ABC-type uncharacterized transport system ATPase subunit